MIKHAFVTMLAFAGTPRRCSNACRCCVAGSCRRHALQRAGRDICSWQGNDASVDVSSCLKWIERANGH